MNASDMKSRVGRDEIHTPSPYTGFAHAEHPRSRMRIGRACEPPAGKLSPHTGHSRQRASALCASGCASGGPLRGAHQRRRSAEVLFADFPSEPNDEQEPSRGSSHRRSRLPRRSGELIRAAPSAMLGRHHQRLRACTEFVLPPAQSRGMKKGTISVRAPTSIHHTRPPVRYRRRGARPTPRRPRAPFACQKTLFPLRSRRCQTGPQNRSSQGARSHRRVTDHPQHLPRPIQS